MDFDERGIVIGFLAALAVLGGLLWFVGFDDILAALRLLDLSTFLGIVALGVVWLASWGLALRRVLDSIGVAASALDAFLLYAAAAFANNITPFGQAGGEPFSALLISRATGSDYEEGLAAIASVDTLNFIPSLLLAVLGLTYYTLTYAVGDRVQLVSAAVAVLAVTIPLTGYLLWRYRDRFKAALASTLAPVLRVVARVVPGFSAPGAGVLRDRIAAFYRSIGRVAANRRDLAFALAYSTLGWLVMCLALYATLWGLVPVSFSVAIVFVVVPVATIASVTPLPGGAGGVEFAIVLLLVPTTSVDAATATSAALVFRAATYWIPTVIGGVAAFLLESRA
ncbi:lysylphosphatidylglycerol synthase transmembrane domain-containing protein [Salarchaeum sp. JOR-1]|uniref:lysylphosphatidylglycerol synthase transmembrane domain-containing protein n=1 Tax=Salarchaeum sp. JOR-1 TaxID=2599399 RepID=UPI0011987D9C|nr:lysylphosphatidylglycerol synthase transmembrane domain-containing protein [Salarchaeum sp. JOR-1]QDX40487.1 flippase-like domain-containing protein [Salarchaeum sp. JOR-1]